MVEVSEGSPPDALVESLDASEALFLSLLPPDGWQPVFSSGGISVCSRPAEGSRTRRYRVDMRLEGVTAPIAGRIVDELVSYERRLVWDSGISSTRTMRRFEADRAEVIAFTTHAVMGGLIPPRIFVDCRRTTVDAQDGSVLACAVNWKEDDELIAQLARGHVRGCNQAGGGILIAPAAKGRGDASAEAEWVLTMAGCADIGGWVPTNLVNEGTKSAFLSIFRGLFKNVISRDYPGVRIVGS
jgi:hypothetical protein